MQKKISEIKLIGYGLSAVYGLGLLVYLAGFLISLVNPQAILNSQAFLGKFQDSAQFQRHVLLIWVLYFPQFVGFVGVAKFKEWGRRLVIMMNSLVCLYAVFQMVFVFQKIDPLSLLNIFIYIAVILFFLQPRIKEQFSTSSGPIILVVDDDKTLLRIIRGALGGHGFNVLTATTGEKGLKIAMKIRPDLIILDVILPGMKGREVCTKLKTDSRTRDIPVVFLTAKDSPDDVRAEMEAGGAAHLTKPVDAQRLLSEITRILA